VAVSAALSGLSEDTTYHFRIVATNAGGSSAGADETFKTTSAKQPPSSSGGGGTGGNAGGPVLAIRETIRVVSGTVTIRIKGTSTFVPLSATSSIPDGSEVDVTNGRVVITVATPTGGTATAEVYGGRFRIHQDRSGETHFILTLPLTGCSPVSLPRGSAAALGSAAKSRSGAKHGSGPTSRHLWVSEQGGSWGTDGRYASTTVRGTTWLTLDECTTSEVEVTAGKVQALDLVRKRSKTVSAGQRYVASASPHRRRR
jgi:hypothetical protein